VRDLVATTGLPANDILGDLAGWSSKDAADSDLFRFLVDEWGEDEDEVK
jgi:hypothetical protein